MSRSGYSDDLDPRDLVMYRGQVANAIKGKRGQKLLRDLVEALDAMPVKRLGEGVLRDETGNVCALGAVAEKRGLDISEFPTDYGNPEYFEPENMGELFDVARQLAAEVMYVNDEMNYNPETPEQRWVRVRQWAAANIKAGGS